MQVVGLEHKDGTFEGNAYDNYYLYVIDNAKKDSKALGLCPQKIKVKASVLHQFIAPDQVGELIRSKAEIDFFYDAYKNVAKVVKL